MQDNNLHLTCDVETVSLILWRQLESEDEYNDWMHSNEAEYSCRLVTIWTDSDILLHNCGDGWHCSWWFVCQLEKMLISNETLRGPGTMKQYGGKKFIMLFFIYRYQHDHFLHGPFNGSKRLCIVVHVLYLDIANKSISKTRICLWDLSQSPLSSQLVAILDDYNIPNLDIAMCCVPLLMNN